MPLTPTQQTALDELRQCAQEANCFLTEGTLKIIIEAEPWGPYFDIDTRSRIAKPSDDWQDFTNFWMDMMWTMRKQRNYIKLALVMQSIAEREQRQGYQSWTFEHWCGKAKSHQAIYFYQHDPQMGIKALS